MPRVSIATLAVLIAGLSLSGAEADWFPVERQVKEAVAAKSVTVVHFWAPWCGNCLNESGEHGWSEFIDRNPRVRFIFIECWNDGKDSRAVLAKHGIGPQSNLTLLVHPAPRRGSGHMRTFMDLPVTWLYYPPLVVVAPPYFAFNYGEIRFPILQQLVKDTQADW